MLSGFERSSRKHVNIISQTNAVPGFAECTQRNPLTAADLG